MVWVHPDAPESSTVMPVDPETGAGPGYMAVIVVWPDAPDEAKPREPSALLTVATDTVDEPQVTTFVMSSIEESVYVPRALNCWFVPRMMVRSAGVIDRVTSSALVIVSVVDLVIVVPGYVAVIVVAPVAAEDASPREPSALLIVAVNSSDELQVTS